MEKSLLFYYPLRPLQSSKCKHLMPSANSKLKLQQPQSGILFLKHLSLVPKESFHLAKFLAIAVGSEVKAAVVPVIFNYPAVLGCHQVAKEVIRKTHKGRFHACTSFKVRSHKTSQKIRLFKYLLFVHQLLKWCEGLPNPKRLLQLLLSMSI